MSADREECERRGWHAVIVPGVGWQPCGADILGALPDHNRLAVFRQTGRDELYTLAWFHEKARLPRPWQVGDPEPQEDPARGFHIHAQEYPGPDPWATRCGQRVPLHSLAMENQQVDCPGCREKLLVGLDAERTDAIKRAWARLDTRVIHPDLDGVVTRRGVR